MVEGIQGPRNLSILGWRREAICTWKASRLWGALMGLSLSVRDGPSADSLLCHTHSSPSHSSVEGCEHWLRFAFLSPFSSLFFPVLLSPPSQV